MLLNVDDLVWLSDIPSAFPPNSLLLLPYVCNILSNSHTPVLLLLQVLLSLQCSLFLDDIPTPGPLHAGVDILVFHVLFHGHKGILCVAHRTTQNKYR